jgi:hypothetical protein
MVVTMTRKLEMPNAKRVAEVSWSITAVAVGAWYVYDTGMWAKMNLFWRVMSVFAAIAELWLLTHKYSLSEDIWSYLPDRHIIGLAFGALGIHLFGTPDPSHIWYLLMGHFFFTPKRMSVEEIFEAALKAYANQVALLDKYRDLMPNPAPAPVMAGQAQITINVDTKKEG